MENIDFVADLIVIIIAGLFGGILARAFRQPLILGYIVAGILVGPNTGGYVVKDVQQIQILAEIGVALLLFTLGVEFSIQELKPIGKIAGFGAVIQVALTLLLGFLLGRFFQWNTLASFCLAISIISSSTAVILKSLVTTGHVSALSGRVTLGMSIVQDVMVLPLMIVLIGFKGMDDGASLLGFMQPIFMVALFVGLMVLFGSRVIPAFLKFVASWKSQEIFLLSVIVVSLGIGYVSYKFGLSRSFGACVAGRVLAGSDYAHKALSEMTPVRDIFALLFFVSVGMLLDPMFIVAHFGTILVLVSVACLGRGIILAVLTWSFGYRNVIPYAALLGMLPISEIGFVVISSSLQNGIITETEYSYILNMIVVSMLVGPPISLLTAPVYRFSQKWFSRNRHATITVSETKLTDHVIIAGGRYLARYIGRALSELGIPYVIIEPNHQMFVFAQMEKLNVLFGEPHQRLILQAAGIDSAKTVLVTAKNRNTIRAIVEAAQETRPDVPFIVQYEGYDGAELLDELRLDGFIQPEHQVGIEMLRQSFVRLGIDEKRIDEYLEQIRTRLLHRPRATR